MFDRADVGQATNACMRLKMSKHAKGSVVLLRVDGDLSAARVKAFLLYPPPGHDFSAQGGNRSIQPDLALYTSIKCLK